MHMAITHSLYRESGTVRINSETCIRCGQCGAICAADVLRQEDGNIAVHAEALLGCIACGHCMMVCPTGSVTVTGRGISPEDLQPLPAGDGKAGIEALEALLRSRRSIRRFAEREVEPELLERIVELAACAPMGIPPWDVGCVIVRGRDQVQEIAREVARGYAGFLKMMRPWVLALMRPFMRRATYELYRNFLLALAEEYVTNQRAGRDVILWGAPAVLIFHHSPYADAADTPIAATYAMLAAEALGLGSTIIGGAPPIIQRNHALRRRLGIPEGHVPSLALIVGYPRAKFRRTIRRRFVAVHRVS
jgi:nitroreductase/NAD-dependent dihydropyrimidine dehydrogenase PreA subunit